jgi:GTP-binding protein
MFIDHAKIYIKAGNGGNGAVSFRREKYVANGGPDGGDGGKGGDVIFKATNNMSTLADFRYKKKYSAANGMDGSSSNKSGKSGDDLIIMVPMGTIIYNDDNGDIIADLVKNNDEIVVATGGRGGSGNQHFATSTRQVPGFAKAGIKGEERNLRIELKLLAEVGLLGYPNVGKSSFLARVTTAKPKIANYHFTTIIPNLGIVSTGNEKSYVIADIPGLIEGANENVGLGHEFLRHVERTKVLVHFVDVSGSEGRNPAHDFDIINKELFIHDEKMKNKPQIIAANKIDIMQDENILSDFILEMKKRDIKVYPVSAITGDGIDELMYRISEVLDEVKDEKPETVERSYKVYKTERINEKEFEVVCEDDIYYVNGPMIDRLMPSINIDDSDSLGYFQKILRNKGIIKELRTMGVAEGDTVVVGSFEFEFIE